MTHRLFYGSALLPALLIAASTGLEAQATGGATPVAEAVRRAGEIVIDGRLDEPEWQRARPLRGFVASEPVEGVPAEHDTEVYVLYDDEAVYVGARMYDPEPATIFRQLTRRGEIGRAADYFEVHLDSNLDRRTGYTFRISAAGVQEDRFRYDDTSGDGSWDAVWESAVQIGEGEWTAELRIPLSQLRYAPSSAPQTWGANFARRRNASGEKSFWALESRMQHGGVSVFGRLHGLELSRATRALEVRPYLMGRHHTALADAGDPFFDGSEQAFNAGADIRYGLGSTFVLNLTLNPDFGHVEVDPAVINLTALETFFPERRPFFTSDDRLFDFPLSGPNNLFYSRRIGRPPQGRAPPGAPFVELSRETTILGAGKVTGRTAGGLTLGALAALTGAERGSAYYPGEDRLQSFPAEPATLYGVVRAQQDLREGASQVAAIATWVERDLPPDGALDWLTSRALSAGVDFEHSWQQRTWALWGFLAGSHVTGATEAITRIQRAPGHYHQRPDAHYLSVDSTATSLAGAEWRLQFERRSGRHWTGAIWAAQVTPRFEINDIGRSQVPERLDGGVRVTYQEITPGSLFRSYRITANTFQNWRHELFDAPLSLSQWDRSHRAGRLNLSSNWTFLNYWSVDLGAGYKPEFLSDVLTRGGPLMVSPGAWDVSLGFATDGRDAFSVNPSLSLGRAGGGGESLTLGISLDWRPTTAAEISFGPEWDTQLDPAQYVLATGDVGYAPTFGPRYIFAELDRRTLTLPVRLNWAFSPTLTLQHFAQPLISSGDFLAYKQLARAESFEFEVFENGQAVVGPTGVTCGEGRTCVLDGRRYLQPGGAETPPIAFADRDFNLRSLRSSSVLRWEYRPGSTLFVVWQQSRESRDGLGDFLLRRDTDALLRARPANTFLVKVNYWLGI